MKAQIPTATLWVATHTQIDDHYGHEEAFVRLPVPWSNGYIEAWIQIPWGGAPFGTALEPGHRVRIKTAVNALEFTVDKMRRVEGRDDFVEVVAKDVLYEGALAGFGQDWYLVWPREGFDDDVVIESSHGRMTVREAHAVRLVWHVIAGDWETPLPKGDCLGGWWYYGDGPFKVAALAEAYARLRDKGVAPTQRDLEEIVGAEGIAALETAFWERADQGWLCYFLGPDRNDAIQALEEALDILGRSHFSPCRK